MQIAVGRAPSTRTWHAATSLLSHAQHRHQVTLCPWIERISTLRVRLEVSIVLYLAVAGPLMSVAGLPPIREQASPGISRYVRGPFNGFNSWARCALGVCLLPRKAQCQLATSSFRYTGSARITFIPDFSEPVIPEIRRIVIVSHPTNCRTWRLLSSEPQLMWFPSDGICG